MAAASFCISERCVVDIPVWRSVELSVVERGVEHTVYIRSAFTSFVDHNTVNGVGIRGAGIDGDDAVGVKGRKNSV